MSQKPIFLWPDLNYLSNNQYEAVMAFIKMVVTIRDRSQSLFQSKLVITRVESGATIEGFPFVIKEANPGYFISKQTKLLILLRFYFLQKLAMRMLLLRGDLIFVVRPNPLPLMSDPDDFRITISFADVVAHVVAEETQKYKESVKSLYCKAPIKVIPFPKVH